MERLVLALIIVLSTVSSQAQILDDLKDMAEDIITDGKLSPEDISAGLKEALVKGVTTGSDEASKLDGFYKNPKIKIPFPKEAKKMAKTLKKIGLKKEVNRFVMTLNRGAESAAKEAKPVFLAAVKSMTIEDAVSILNGSDKQGATNYLKKSTSEELTAKFKPIISKSLESTHATKYYGDLVKRYNKLPMVKKQNADLEAYATQKTLDGLFYLIGQEELKIRENPAERTSDLLKKVFGSVK